MIRQRPHFEKLKAVLVNAKLPESDLPRVKEALRNYENWMAELKSLDGESDKSLVLNKMTRSLNKYKNLIDLNLIFDSENDFLYRQKGQLKLDNTIIEEFLPWLVRPELIPELAMDVRVGPTKCFSSMYFTSRIDKRLSGGGMRIRTKDQDFSICRELFVKTSHFSDFSVAQDAKTFISYVAAEIKTNLDKTMFQEASSTAHDVKASVAGSKYYLLCEWLDMTPVSTAATEIDEILIMRGAKRLSSNVRKNFSSLKGRKASRESFEEFLHANPFRPDVFQRLVDHIRAMLTRDDPVEENVLINGYF